MPPERTRTASIRTTALLLCLATGVSGCGSEDPALAVGDVEYAEDDLLGLSDESRDRLVALTALGLAHARDELDRVAEPLAEREAEELLLERFRAELALEEAGVEDEVLRAQYETAPRDELVVRHVVALADEEAPDSVHEAARERARRALERIEAGEEFAEVAADLSEEPGADERGGLLSPGREGTWVPEFWRAASSLEEGEHSDVVRSSYGYHVLRLEERRTVPFEEVRSDVVLEAGRMLGGMDEAWERWLEEEAPSDSSRARDRALQEARERGLRVPQATRERVVREWRGQLAGWALALGFETGASAGEVRARALEALSTTRQNARIARRELEPHEPVLRDAYPVRRAP